MKCVFMGPMKYMLCLRKVLTILLLYYNNYYLLGEKNI